MEAARKRLNKNNPRDWEWLADALSDPVRKNFVAILFERHPVPRRLSEAFIRAAVYEHDPSCNEAFITPCVRTWGGRRVIERLFDFLLTGSNEERAGAVSAMYWAFGEADKEDLDDLRRRRHHEFLREFVENDDLNVRCRIIPMLTLDESIYPDNLRPLVQKAIMIARHHNNEYIRHRVEIQLGGEGPFMAIPT